MTQTKLDRRQVRMLYQITYSLDGYLEVAAGHFRFPVIEDGQVIEVRLDVDIAPTGAAIIVDVHHNGVTIFTNQAHRPQIAAGAYSGSSVTIDAPDLVRDDYVQVDVDAVGSTIAGSYLTVTVRYLVTEEQL